ncbi:MAG: DUF1592 domain-containing protein [Fimbriiglobus sp.]
MLRFLILLTFLFASSTTKAAEPWTGFLEQHCISCHNSQIQEGRLNLESLSKDFSKPELATKWTRVLDRTLRGEMPPVKKPRPDLNAHKPALDALRKAVIDAETKYSQTQGRRAIRRLNQQEFENTLRDLLDLPWLDVREMLPPDGRYQGYSKSAEALDVSPILMAKYAEVIDHALKQATAQTSVPPETLKERLYANQEYDFQVLIGGGDAVMLKDKKYDTSKFPMPAGDEKIPYPDGKWQYGGKYKNHGEATHAGLFKEPSTLGLTRTFGESFPARFGVVPLFPGRYRISVSAWSYWWDKGELKPFPRDGSVAVYLGSQVVGFAHAPSLNPKQTDFELDFEPKPDSFLRAAGASFLDAHVYFQKGQISAYTGPGVAIDWIHIEGPLHDQWPPASHHRLFDNLPLLPIAKLPTSVPKPPRTRIEQQGRGGRNPSGRQVFGTVVSEDPPADARRLLTKFLPRAFRRDVTWDEVEKYASHAMERLQAGLSFEEAMHAAYKRALLSPSFLFHLEPVGPLDGFALANRLSYFLWNSPPDDTLTKLARSGRLTDPKVLREEGIRMVQSPKSERFAEDFLNQWLELRDFDSTSPDRRLYPDFQPDLEHAMRQEPRLFFRKAMQDNFPTSELFVGGFHLVNQRLAEHYGLPPFQGTEFRTVHTEHTKFPRGGFTTMAAVMKVTANGTTTSPVKRGAWLMTHLLGQPPEPPPPSIPAIEPDVRGATNIREQLAKHRESPSCAACHAKFDPPGFALEAYDPIGGMREFYRATEGKKPFDPKLMRAYLGPNGEPPRHLHFNHGQVVDASGEWASGQKFAGMLELRQQLRSRTPELSANLMNQLVIYSTGAKPRLADRAELEAILARTPDKNPRIRDMILDIITSKLFIEK